MRQVIAELSVTMATYSKSLSLTLKEAFCQQTTTIVYPPDSVAYGSRTSRVVRNLQSSLTTFSQQSNRALPYRLQANYHSSTSFNCNVAEISQHHYGDKHTGSHLEPLFPLFLPTSLRLHSSVVVVWLLR
ncbi:hypothetical protein EB796_005032 [Bugula neritina]|uniref:Uncharacterized protein n=1 Tax=Bugula neritina TaxID=10212 RepID=A0A7J7KDB2_BUGNE|nr:hypothetical protein EB796_005032 [Bugula neritina]